jgi:hypothetical protein
MRCSYAFLDFLFLCLTHAYRECGGWLYLFTHSLRTTEDDELIFFDVISRYNYNIPFIILSRVLLICVESNDHNDHVCRHSSSIDVVLAAAWTLVGGRREILLTHVSDIEVFIHIQTRGLSAQQHPLPTPPFPKDEETISLGATQKFLYGPFHRKVS